MENISFSDIKNKTVSENTVNTSDITLLFILLMKLLKLIMNL